MRGTRALLALVIAMGVLIVIGSVTLIAVVMHRLAHPSSGVRSTAMTTAGGAQLAQEPPGTRIVTLVRQSDTLLAIGLTGGGPDRVLIWDLAAARPFAELRLAPAGDPAAPPVRAAGDQAAGTR